MLSIHTLCYLYIHAATVLLFQLDTQIASVDEVPCKKTCTPATQNKPMKPARKCKNNG